MLRSEAGQLLHAVEILERIRERLAALRVHHLLHGNFFTCLIADGIDIVGRKVILFAVNGHEFVNFSLRNGIHLLHEIADGPGVDLPAELLLYLYLIALCDGDVAHIVAETHDLHVLRDGHADGRLHPAADARLHVLILPVPGDDLARLAKSCADEAVLTVTVRCLIEVHEVHVDLFIGNFAVILRGEMRHGFWSRSRPLIHIFDGLNVWHHVTIPAQESS